MSAQRTTEHRQLTTEAVAQASSKAFDALINLYDCWKQHTTNMTEQQLQEVVDKLQHMTECANEQHTEMVHARELEHAHQTVQQADAKIAAYSKEVQELEALLAQRKKDIQSATNERSEYQQRVDNIRKRKTLG